MAARTPSGFNAWPEQPAAQVLDASDVQKMYDGGFSGIWEDPDLAQQYDQEEADRTGYGSVDSAAHANGWADSGAGKLSIPFVCALELYPGCLPGAAQQRGDCVSHGTKNAAFGTTCYEIYIGNPDQVSGRVEGKFEVPAAGVSQGAMAPESIYWYRGYDRDGWYGSASAKVVREYGMGWPRRVHDVPGFGELDLTKYSGRLAGKYGSRRPPESIQKYHQDHQIRTTAKANSPDEWRDALANGYILETCGGQGFSNRRDDNGVSKRSGSWAHSMSLWAFDDRPWARETYGQPLVLVQNSWARFNRGGREIHDSAKYVPAAKRDLWRRLGITADSGNVLIPEGSFWARVGDLRGRNSYAYSGAEGWPIQRAPFGGAALAGF